MRIYQNLKQINIITFWEIAETENFALMDIDHDDTKEYSIEDLELCKVQYLKLYDDYFIAQDDGNQKNVLENNDKTTKESYKIYLLSEFAKSIKFIEYNKEKIRAENYAEMLNDVYSGVELVEKRVKFNRMNGSKKNLEKLERIISQLESAILLRDTRSTQDKNKEVKKFKNHYENIANMEQGLNRSLGDVSKINALQWVAYVKTLEQIIKQQKNERRKSYN